MMRANGVTVIDGLLDIEQRQHELDWQYFRPGIESYTLFEGQESPSKVMLLRYQPGASAPAHIHQGVEYIFVLSGSQTDAQGRHEVGSLVIHPKDTEHHVYSEEGCIVLAIWEQSVRFI